MTKEYTRRLLALAAATTVVAAGAIASTNDTDTGSRARYVLTYTDNDDLKKQDAAISNAIVGLPDDVKRFNDHLTTLASPYMEGRVPGSEGMERSKDYMEYWFRNAGLEPCFEVEGQATLSYRQPFPLGGTTEIKKAVLSYKGNGFVHETDFAVTAMGESGSVRGEPVFVGYSINDGPDGYNTFGDDVDLSGKVAVMLRFEPLDEAGKSAWSEQGRWTNAASFNNKLNTVARHNPAAVIIVNTPGADDSRINSLMSATSGGSADYEFPVFHMSPSAGGRLVELATNGRTTIEALRDQANEAGLVMPMGGRMTLESEIERTPFMAENVGGIIPGKGDLADEYIVIGAHLDHLGMGNFGSRAAPEDRGAKLHPGADDNASGSAGLIIMAEALMDAYAEMDDDANARSIIFVAFSGEESGLNGSRYYTNNPIGDIEDHYLMLNFDMIGRIKDGRLSVTGASSGEGMSDWVEPIFERSPLTIIQSRGTGGGSDHLPFMQKQVPFLFGIIADFHQEYHTPADTSDKINRVGAVLASRLFAEIALEAAQRPESMEFTNPRAQNRRNNAAAPRMSGEAGEITVRFGIMPGSYDEDAVGIPIASVSAEGPAEKAGLQGGDVLVRWDGQKISDVQSWMGMLAKHKPGDEVNVGVMRDGTEVTLRVTLEAR